MSRLHRWLDRLFPATTTIEQARNDGGKLILSPERWALIHEIQNDPTVTPVKVRRLDTDNEV